MTLSTFSVCCRTAEHRCPPALPVWAFYHGWRGCVFANIQINFQSALRQAGSTSTSGASTHMKNTNPESLTPKLQGPHPTNSISWSVTEIWDACFCNPLPRLPGCEIVVLERKIITSVLPQEATFSGTLLSRQLLSREGGGGDAKHGITAKASKPESERAVNSGNSPASCSVISLKDSRAVICKSPAKCSAQHFPLLAEWHYKSIIETI